jgi:hypothetical protein
MPSRSHVSFDIPSVHAHELNRRRGEMSQAQDGKRRPLLRAVDRPEQRLLAEG